MPGTLLAPLAGPLLAVDEGDGVPESERGPLEVTVNGLLLLLLPEAGSDTGTVLDDLVVADVNAPVVDPLATVLVTTTSLELVVFDGSRITGGPELTLREVVPADVAVSEMTETIVAVVVVLAMLLGLELLPSLLLSPPLLVLPVLDGAGELMGTLEATDAALVVAPELTGRDDVSVAVLEPEADGDPEEVAIEVEAPSADDELSLVSEVDLVVSLLVSDVDDGAVVETGETVTTELAALEDDARVVESVFAVELKANAVVPRELSLLIRESLVTLRPLEVDDLLMLSLLLRLVSVVAGSDVDAVEEDQRVPEADESADEDELLSASEALDDDGEDETVAGKDPTVDEGLGRDFVIVVESAELDVDGLAIDDDNDSTDELAGEDVEASLGGLAEDVEDDASEVAEVDLDALDEADSAARDEDLAVLVVASALLVLAADSFVDVLD